jgi:hypothetical protein
VIAHGPGLTFVPIAAALFPAAAMVVAFVAVQAGRGAALSQPSTQDVA